MAAAIEGYASVTSAAPGETVDFHVRAAPANSHFTMQISRRGITDEPLSKVEGDAFAPGAQDDAALAQSGCGWPAVSSCRTVIPPQWRSGYYVAELTSLDQSTTIPFFVRSAAPGTTSPILLKMSDSTAQAYTGWGGRSLYSTPFAPNISFDRPYDDMSLFERYQIPFIRWAEANGIALDFCSSLDLHTDPNILAPYRLLISIGHDEYWSLEMRDQVEAFIASGGNVAFLSANTCFWQVRLDLDGQRIMTCYKETEGKPPDPERDDPRRITVEWSKPPVNRPENSLTGVAYRNGAGFWQGDDKAAHRMRGYTVTNAAHWVFAGTNLSNGDVFGKGTSVDDTILGYETDAALLVPGRVPPVVTGADGTPHDFVVLATADLSDWQPNGKGGSATMGIYQRNGIALTVGTVNWAGGLSADGSSTPVDLITQNIVRELSRERAPRTAVANAGFEDWANNVPVGWVLDGAGSVSAQTTDPAVAANQLRFGAAGQRSMQVDASPGETWISCANLSFAGRKTYGAGCWIKSSSAGATIRLQTTDTWLDFATAAHSGSGDWEYVFAVGSPARDDAAVPGRVKIQVAAGARAVFDDVDVIEIVDHGA